MKALLGANVLAWLVAIPPTPAQGVENTLENSKAWAAARVQKAEASYGQGGRFPSPASWSGQVVYGIVVDRFNDGDPANNPPAQGPVSQARHGGDLRGIRERLDYLADLGVTALWLTPIFVHDGNYHGYCATDPTQVDPGFGTLQELQALVREAHDRGMRVLLDMVVNHLCDPSTAYAQPPDHARCGDDLMAAHWLDAAPRSPAQGALRFAPNFFTPLAQQQFFNRCGVNSAGETGSDGSIATFGDFVGTMFDYNTRDPDFTQLFIDLHKYWIAVADIDGYRLDAARHVTEDFLANLSTQLRDYAHGLGKDNFYLVAEVYGDAQPTARRFGGMFSDPREPQSNGGVPASLTHTLERLKGTYLAHPAAPYPGPNGVFHFGAAYPGRDYLQNRAGGTAVRDYYGSEAYRTVAAQGDVNLSLNFLDSHDWPRFANPAAHDPWKSQVAVGYLNTTPGIPVYYYGTEQGFNGVCPDDGACEGFEDTRYRQDMFAHGPWRLRSTVPQIDALAGVGFVNRARSSHWSQDPMLARDHAVYRMARRFARLRGSCVALQQGSMEVHHADDALLVFSRRSDTGAEMIVAINSASSGRRLPALPARRTDGSVYRNVVAREGTLTVQGGMLPGGADLPGNTVWAWAPADTLQPWDETLGVTLCADGR